jgi:exonuclease III
MPPHEKFPEAAIRKAGYCAIWQRTWMASLFSRGAEIQSRADGDCSAIRTKIHSRYIEAHIDSLLVGCLYLPNGNPAPGPKFDYKLRWLERLTKHAEALMATAAPVVLVGDSNVIPTELDFYKLERWLMMRYSSARDHAETANTADAQMCQPPGIWSSGCDARLRRTFRSRLNILESRMAFRRGLK